jgi:putative transcriptional regulator
MLEFNPRRVFALRGIDRPAAFMVKNGVNRQTANNVLRQETSVVKIWQLEMLCRLLNCTPNDLFEWRAAGADVLPESHSLNSLKRNDTVQSIRETIKSIPLEKVESLIKEQ